jgi:hypothetical protein
MDGKLIKEGAACGTIAFEDRYHTRQGPLHGPVDKTEEGAAYGTNNIESSSRL